MSPLVPTGADLNRETLLDVTVNLIPMAILLFFVALTLVINPFEPDPFVTVMSHLLTLIPFFLLGLLTYVSAKVIARDERERRNREPHDSVGVEETPAGADETTRTDES